ncbi:hypothetical protein Y1Q_0013831 [Alligator mississippiensis]|uniref:Uncharacterized protein n=1 Tax=Alligator mississippiensis TaxID=8496 RepID=A0A151NFN6_ALLMI|nr:hypothetical protein Y1Q_0013831 [Alligator mississippiensis]
MSRTQPGTGPEASALQSSTLLKSAKLQSNNVGIDCKRKPATLSKTCVSSYLRSARSAAGRPISVPGVVHLASSCRAGIDYGSYWFAQK